MSSDKEQQNRAFWNSEAIISRYQNDKQHHKEGEIRIFGEVLDADDHVLELGCGEGRITSYIEPMVGHLTAVDIAPGMVYAATERLDEPDLAIADASELPFDDDTFDTVLFPFNGIDYLSPSEQRRRTIDEVQRVLKPGGDFVFSSHNQFWIPINPIKWPSYLRKHVLTGNIRKKYRYTPTVEDGEELASYTFYANPSRQVSRLRDAGFEIRAVEDEPNSRLLKYIKPWLYYVCRLPE